MLLKLGKGKEFLLTATTFDQVALFVELPPIVGSMLYKLILNFAASLWSLTITRADVDFLPMQIQQMHLHVSKGGRDDLTAATFYLQLHGIFMILFI